MNEKKWKIYYEAAKLEYEYAVTNSSKLDNKAYILLTVCAFLFAALYTVMGYVKEEDFKFHDLYAYVSSNRKINGSFYILNKRFVDNINSIDMRQSYQYIYNTWDDYTLEGYTKILTHGTRP